MAFDFDPKTPLAGGIQSLPDAVIVPITAHPKNQSPRPGGIVDAKGSYVVASACYYNERKRWTIPCTIPVDEPVQNRAGTWLYGGILDASFGHCIVESFARLWAMDHIDDALEGVAFLPSVHRDNFGQARKYLRYTASLYAAFEGLPENRHCARSPHRFERLILAPQGMGGGSLSGGCPEFRHFVKSRLFPRVAPDGGEKLYVSRARLKVMGNILFEDRIEDLFRRNGYEVFHPEEHSLAEQTARYRAAQKIVTVEGSALHFIAYALQPDRPVQIGIIPRRTTDNLESFEQQFAYQTAAKVSIFGAPDRMFHPRRIYGEQSNVKLLHDLPILANRLAMAGFLPESAEISAPSDDEIRADLATLPKQMFMREIDGAHLSEAAPFTLE